jgi:hypothetical protein
LLEIQICCNASSRRAIVIQISSNSTKSEEQSPATTQLACKCVSINKVLEGCRCGGKNTKAKQDQKSKEQQYGHPSRAAAAEEEEEHGEEGAP